MIKVYHLNLEKKQIQKARLALMPGDPFRVPKIAEEIHNIYGGEIQQLAWKREYQTYLCHIGSQKILVTSTGIGGPSTSIAIEELAILGVNTFLRGGTTGAIQKQVEVGDVIISAGSVRLDGASTHYAPIQYPALAHHEVVNALVEASRSQKIPYHVGVTASADTFYPGQERYDSFTGYVIRDFQGSLQEWQKLGVLNYEMETAAMFTMAGVMGLRAGCVAGVIVNRTGRESITAADLQLGEHNAVRAAAAAVGELLKAEQKVKKPKQTD